MPNIFPPIDLASPVLQATVPADQSSILGTVAPPSSSSLALTGAQNDLQAAQDKLAADTPKKYDYSAHGVLGNIGHVLGRFGNIAGDILDPAATALIPGSDLNKAGVMAGDRKQVQQATENAAGAQRESDTVNNEQANRDQSASEFDAQAPQRDATLASTQANTMRAQQETAASIAAGLPLDAHSARSLNTAWGTDLFSPGMSPQEVSRLSEAHKAVEDAKAKAQEFQARLQETQQTHADAEKDRSLSRDIALQNHADAEKDKNTAATDKANKPYQSVLDDVDEAKQFAAQNTGYGDYGLVMKYVDATKPSSGFRFNQTEAAQIYGAASIADKFRRAYESGAHGNLLAPEQRAQILHALEVPAAAAQKHLSGGGGAAAGAPPAGAKIIDFTTLGQK